MQVKTALLSVSDKTGLVEFARGLSELGVKLLSTGGTARKLRESGLQVQDVSYYTGFPEIMDGRVKTLHPKVHAGLLALRDNPAHMQALQEIGAELIDLVVVNLYPFEATIARPDCTYEEALENIDIGGPTMVRAAAKNQPYVGVVTDPGDYAHVLAELRASGGLNPETCRKLALKAFQHTARYDAHIANYLHSQLESATFPAELVLPLKLDRSLRYGENPHQAACFYVNELEQAPWGVAFAEQLHGKELSFNNLNDATSAWQLVNEFDQTACVLLKHTNPCGVALGKSVAEAYVRAFECDTVSPFGGIVAVNRTLDAAAAEEMSKLFLEVILAPDFTDEALEILMRKKNLRLLKARPGKPAPGTLDFKRIDGGLLVQEADTQLLPEGELEIVTDKQPSEFQLADMLFAWTVVKYVRSNAIVLAKDGATVGIGAGQMNRVQAARIASEQAGSKALGAALASDAFFPFRDSIDTAAEVGVQAIIQPGGSIRDEEVITAANQHRMTMAFTRMRHFKH